MEKKGEGKGERELFIYFPHFFCLVFFSFLEMKIQMVFPFFLKDGTRDWNLSLAIGAPPLKEIFSLLSSLSSFYPSPHPPPFSSFSFPPFSSLSLLKEWNAIEMDFELVIFHFRCRPDV